MTTTLIPISGGGQTIVDSDIAEKLGTRRLHRNSEGYAVMWHSGAHLRFHRFVCDASPGQIIDHLNGNKLDNRRANLRYVTHSQNHLNRHCSPHARSGYRGVHRRRATKHWRLTIQVAGKRLHFSSAWRSKHVAALFMDRRLAAIVGSFAKRNFERTLPANRVCRFIADTKGRIFTVVFSRRSDGAQRVMTCRTGVKSHSKGGASSYCACLRGLALVWDLQKREYRTIPVDRVIAIKFAKVNYRIEANHEDMYAPTRRAA